MYRMTGTIRPSSPSPSEKDFAKILALQKDVLAALDAARERIENVYVAETIFHLRGFLLANFEEILDHLRPRK